MTFRFIYGIIYTERKKEMIKMTIKETRSDTYKKLIKLRTKAIKGSEEDLKIYINYCKKCLADLLQENQEILKRLKEK